MTLKIEPVKSLKSETLFNKFELPLVNACTALFDPDQSRFNSIPLVCLRCIGANQFNKTTNVNPDTIFYFISIYMISDKNILRFL